jgi:hypothetical protein
MADFHFVTDRLAVGNVASRATPGFCAVVSLLATQPWDEVMGAPEVPESETVKAKPGGRFPWAGLILEQPNHVLHIDISDGETRRLRPDNGETYGNDLDTYLDDATSFIAAHLRRGCVLVHCGAGKSRSVAVAVAYFCRYAGMNLYEAKNLVFGCVPGAKLYPCFEEAIKRWLKLDELERQGPRQVMLRRLTQQGEEMGMYKQEDLP